MFDLLYNKIKAIIPITEEEFTFCKTLFIQKHFRKRQYLLRSGEVCKYQAFVVNGILRSYTVDRKGDEHILQFAPEGWWIADLSSYLTNEPSIFNIETIEDSDVLLIIYPDWQLLMEKIPKFEQFFRTILQNHLIATQRRLLQSFSETAEEKYTRFTTMYPECVLRVPQRMVASYLGIGRETLSRLRKHQTFGS